MKANIPKVLIVDLSKDYGGASARALTLMQNYPQGRIILAALENSPVAQYALEKNLSTIVVGKKKYDVRIFFSLTKAIRVYGIDIVDVQNIQSKFWGSLSAFFSKVTLVSTLNSWYFSEHQRTNIKGMIYTAIELLTNWSMPHYIVVSQKIFDALCRVRVNPNCISLVYNAVDVNMTQAIEDTNDIRTKLNVPLDASICVALGRLVWAKGYEDLIQAFTLLKGKKHNLFCAIIGGGELQSSLSKKIVRDNLTDRIFLLGHFDHKNALSAIKTCDIFVMPSRTEGTPIALLEAAALGIPILATNIGGIPELVTEQDALLVPANSPEALAAGLLKLAKDNKLAQLLSKNAYCRVNELFSVRKLLSATLDASHKALSCDRTYGSVS